MASPDIGQTGAVGGDGIDPTPGVDEQHAQAGMQQRPAAGDARRSAADHDYVGNRAHYRPPNRQIPRRHIRHPSTNPSLTRRAMMSEGGRDRTM
jgi:hypothetical protein